MHIYLHYNYCDVYLRIYVHYFDIHMLQSKLRPHKINY